MSDILGGGFQSRLFQKVRTRLGYAYEISSDLGRQLTTIPAFSISAAAPKPAAPRKHCRRLTLRCSASRRRRSPAQEELDSAKQTVLNGFIFNFDTPSKTLNRLLTYRYFGYPDDFIFQYQKAVAQVTRADVLRVARQYIDPAKFAIVLVGNPKDMKTPLSTLGLPITNID